MEKKFICILLLIVAGLLLTGAQAGAQSGYGYDLTWTSVGAASGPLNGGEYSLVSTVGQPEPGVTQSGGDYTLNGGVVDAGDSSSLTPAEKRVYLPLINR